MSLKAPLLIFVSALLVRLLFNVYVTGIENGGLALYPDGKDYDALGWSLAAGSGYAINHAPNTFRPPGYPLFLAAVYALAGHSVAAAKVVQSVLGAFTCVLILAIGSRLFTRRIGLIAGGLAVVYPFLVVYTGFLLSDGLFVFLSTLFLYLLVRLRERFAWRWVAVAGVLLGAMNLTRPSVLLLPAALFFWLWIELGAKRRAAVIAAVLALWMLVPILPWTVRNYLVRDTFILIADHHWAALYASHNKKILQDPGKIGGWQMPENVTDYRGEYLAFMRQTLLHEPLEFLRLEFHKLHRFWGVFPTSSKATSRDSIISLFSYGLLLPFFVAGLVLSLKMPHAPWVLIFWVLHFCLMTLIVYGSTRLRAPVEPVVLLFSAFALERAWARCAGERSNLGLQRVT